jgi:hypothetical protein
MTETESPPASRTCKECRMCGGTGGQTVITIVPPSRTTRSGAGDGFLMDSCLGPEGSEAGSR